ncbi:ErfK/YbiS/YcfS/YnhG family protein precursor [Ketogulonicigenium robustum]|uniref:ErfK/YbiS/YcfS/YnhG family protein n=1 Tax=Ketogulonicigenium robustum TaxID=92947 RepID=A0A1W6P1B4_9RHOB|nr:ErfK/YbiS/YcfS/YnhG family protein precursor [Ketogulonicigenium robustum]
MAACAQVPEIAAQPEEQIAGIPVSQIVEGYGLLEDEGFRLPPIPPRYLQGVNRRMLIAYPGTQRAGTIEIDPNAKFLYWVLPDGMAWRYPIGVGIEGLGLRGETVIQRKAKWPGWTPTANMLRRDPELYEPFRRGVPGGLASPLGARALYLYRGGRDTYYRIHGTNDLESIGNSGSAGCIRLFNHDIIHLYEMVPNSTRVIIRSYNESVRIEGAAMANRGIELAPYIITPEELFNGESGHRADELASVSGRG